MNIQCRCFFLPDAGGISAAKEDEANQMAEKRIPSSSPVTQETDGKSEVPASRYFLIFFLLFVSYKWQSFDSSFTEKTEKVILSVEKKEK